MMKNLTLLATMVVSAVSIASSTHRSQKEMCRAAADELVGAGSQIEAARLEDIMQTISTACLPVEKRANRPSSLISLGAKTSHKMVAMSKSCHEASKSFKSAAETENETDAIASSAGLRSSYGFRPVAPNPNLIEALYNELLTHCTPANGGIVFENRDSHRGIVDSRNRNNDAFDGDF